MSRKTCSVVITTRNRCNDLRHTLQQLAQLDPQPDGILICLDGCTDGTREMLREFPHCRVIENAVSQGSIPSRDRAFRLVESELIVSLDDDSYPLDAAFIAKASDLAEQHPEAGAFTFPEIRDDGKPANPAMGPDLPGRYVAAYPNCAGVMRRALYGTAAEYPTFFSHAYAEPDYCLQLYAAGHAVWFEPSLPIRHHFTPVERNMSNRHQLNARNELWSAMMRCPFPLVLAVAPFRVFRQFQFAVTQGWGWWSREPLWWWAALTGFPACLRARRPVHWRVYFGWMRLARRHEAEHSDIAAFSRPSRASD